MRVARRSEPKLPGLNLATALINQIHSYCSLNLLSQGSKRLKRDVYKWLKDKANNPVPIYPMTNQLSLSYTNQSAPELCTYGLNFFLRSPKNPLFQFSMQS